MAGQNPTDSKLLNISFHADELASAWSKILDKTSSSTLEAIKDPSTIGVTSGLMNSIVMGGSAFFKFFGVADSINEFRKLWGWGADKDVKEKNAKHGLPMKIGLSSLYVLHAAASALIASVILGATVVAAPVATAIVSSVAFFKGVGEYFKASKDEKNQRKVFEQAEKTLKEEDVDFKRSVALYQDLQESKEEIRSLKNQSTELSSALSEMDKIEEALKKTEDDPAELEKITQALEEDAKEVQSDLSNEIAKNGIIADKSAKPDAYSKRTIEQSIQKAADKVASYTKEKETLLTQIEKAKSGKADVKDLEVSLKEVEQKIQKHSTLKSHFENIQKLEHRVEGLLQQKGKLSEKYAAEPYHDKRDDLKALENEYLELRIQEIKDKIEVKKDPARRLKKIEKLQKDKERIDQSIQSQENPKERLKTIESALRKGLEEQKDSVDKTCKKKEELFNSKEKYAQLFSIKLDPKNDLPEEEFKKKVSSLFNKTSEFIDAKFALRQAKLDKNKKTKNILFTAGVAGLAITACVVWPLAATLAGVMLGIGIAAGVSSLWDRYQKSKIESEKKKEAKSAIIEQETSMRKSLASKVKPSKADPSASAKVDATSPTTTSPATTSPTAASPTTTSAISITPASDPQDPTTTSLTFMHGHQNKDSLRTLASSSPSAAVDQQNTTQDKAQTRRSSGSR